MQAIRTVLFVGLGTMGYPMVSRLARTFHVRVHDVDEARAREIASEINGTLTVDPNRDVVDVDAVILMLPNSSIVERVLIENGLLQAASPGTTFIDMSSSSPESTRTLAQRAHELDLQFVDAPVSGGKAKAVTGQLAIMMGGTAEGKLRAKPVLEALGESITDTGAAGTGHAMKALNNLLSATGLLAACEVLVAGARFGLDPEVMLEVLNHSTGRNQATEVKMAQFVLSRAFNAGFPLDLMVKDLKTALELVRGAVPQNAITPGTVTAWIDAQAYLGDPQADHTAIAKWVESRLGDELFDHRTQHSSPITESMTEHGVRP